MGRISDIVPPLYFTGKSEAQKFLEALDVEIDELEEKVKGLTQLIDVDRCPDDKLPYLAALTNSPLMGDDPIMSRQLIRNWPWLLKIKGTEKSLDLYLNSIGAVDHRIMTYFRDADGNYVEEKPEGEPFLAEDGLWRNSRTHYFGIEVVWNGQEYLRWQGWHEDFIERFSHWLKRAKPFHAELLKWKTTIKDEGQMNLSLGTASFQGKIQKIGRPAMAAKPTLLYCGCTVFETIQMRVGLEKRTMEELFRMQVDRFGRQLEAVFRKLDEISARLDKLERKGMSTWQSSTE